MNAGKNLSVHFPEELKSRNISIKSKAGFVFSANALNTGVRQHTEAETDGISTS